MLLLADSLPAPHQKGAWVLWHRSSAAKASTGDKAVNVESQARLRHDKGQLEEHVRQASGEN